MATSEPLLPTPNAADAYTEKLKSTQQADHTKHSVTLPQALNHPFYSQVAFPASPSPTPDEEGERQTTATSGRRCFESFGKRYRDGSSLKTCVALLLGTKEWYSNKCSLTWKEKVTKSNRLLFLLSPSTRRTEEIGSGLLPTTGAQDYKKRGPNSKQKGVGEVIVMLPTVRAREGNSSPNSKPRDSVQDVIEKAARKGETGQKTGLKLQPAFVEWMMGFPEGWTEIPDSSLLEMRLSRKSQK